MIENEMLCISDDEFDRTASGVTEDEDPADCDPYVDEETDD